MKRPTPTATGPGVALLGQVAAQLTMLAIACNRCDRRGQLSIGRLVAEHGAALPMPAMRRVVARDCPRMIAGHIHDVCGVHFPGLAGLPPAPGR